MKRRIAELEHRKKRVVDRKRRLETLIFPRISPSTQRHSGPTAALISDC